jgi:cystathionine gamma-lyase
MEAQNNTHSQYIAPENSLGADVQSFISKYEHSHLVKKHRGFGTKAIHVGQEPDPISGGVSVAINLSTTFAQKYPGEPFGNFDYARCGHPTREAFEKQMAAVEHGKYGMAFSSGCAVTTTIIQTFVNAGDHVICCDDVYGGTQRYFRQISQLRNNVEFTFVDMTDVSNIEKAIKENTKLIWVETPTNPTLKVCDVEKICALAKSRNVLTAIDNTFPSPYLQSPLLLGADISVNSVTKYIGGHSDVVMGILVCNDVALRDKLFFTSKTIGGTPGPFDCYLALRGLKTLKVRMEATCRSAMIISEYLEAHPKIEKIIYPGLTSHPQHEIAKKQMRGFGGMITFFIKGGIEESRKFLAAMKTMTLAESLGGVESLIECPAVMTHGSVPIEVRKELGISDNLIRLSVGLEDVEDLLYDLQQAFEKI